MAGIAVMNIEKGEEIISALVGGHINGTGRYKFLAKMRKDKTIEWAHYVERDSGAKEKVYRGEVKNEEELKQVMTIMNQNLIKVFGQQAEMKIGVAEFRSLTGERLDNWIN